MKDKKIKTQYPGVRYYEHATRKQRNGQPDRYFSIRYQHNAKTIEDTLGWATEGWNAEKAHKILSELRENNKTGKGPHTLDEMREEAESRRAEAAEAERLDSLTSMTIADFFNSYALPRIKREKRSWLTDEQRFNKKIAPALGDYPLCAVTREDAQAFVDELEDDGLAPATIKQYAGILRSLFNLAAETKVEGATIFTGQNPAARLSYPKIVNARDRFLTGKEAKKLTSAAQKLRYPDLYHAIVLSLNTGLRLGEIRRLEWPDVDLAHGFVTVREESMRKPGGTVPLNEEAEKVLRDRFTQRGDSMLVFPPRIGDKSRENLSHAFRELADSVGLNNGLKPDDRQRRIVFHSLRHTFASWLALAGVDIYRIKTLMRHKNINMTMRYAHLIPDATRDAVHKLKPPKP